MEPLCDSLAILNGTNVANRHYGRTDRLKAVKEVQRLIRQPDVRRSLFHNSYKDILIGSSDAADDDLVSWPFVLSELLDGLYVECEDGIKRISRSYSSAPRKDFVEVLSNVISVCERNSSVSLLTGLTLPLLERALWCLDEPKVVSYLGENIWKMVKDLLENAEYRAQLSAKLYRVWVDKCIAQFASQSSRRHTSDVSATSARRILLLLSTEVFTTDVLAQRGRRGANTEMNTLGYVHIIGKCCEFLCSTCGSSKTCAVPLETEGTLLRVLATVAEERAFDIAGSDILSVIGNVTGHSVSRCWADKKQRPAALLFVRVFSVLLSQQRMIPKAFQRLVRRELCEKVDNARLKVFQDPENDLVVAASVMFSGREICDRVKQLTSFHSIATWLCVLAVYLKRLYWASSDVKDISKKRVTINSRRKMENDWFDVIAAEAITEALHRATGSAKVPHQFLIKAAVSLEFAAKCSMLHGGPSAEGGKATWFKAYHFLRQHLVDASGLETRQGSGGERRIEEILCSSLSIIFNLLKPTQSPSSLFGPRGPTAGWMSLPFFRKGTAHVSHVLFVKAHLKSTMFHLEDNADARNQLLRFLASVCDPTRKSKLILGTRDSVDVFSDAAFATFCAVNGTIEESATSWREASDPNGTSLCSSLEVFEAFQYTFGHSEFYQYGYCTPSDRNALLERSLFPSGGGWFKTLFAYAYNNEVQDVGRFGHANLFTVDDNTRERLSRVLQGIISAYEERLRHLRSAEISRQSENETGHGDQHVVLPSTTQGDGSSLGFQRREIAGACRIISFVAEYVVLLLKYQMGKTQPQANQSGSSSPNLAILDILCRLVKRLGETEAEVFIEKPDIVRIAILSCQRLYVAFCTEEYSEIMSGKLTLLSRTIKESVTCILEDITGRIIFTLQEESEVAHKVLSKYIDASVDERSEPLNPSSFICKKRRSVKALRGPGKRYKYDSSKVIEDNDTSGFDEDTGNISSVLRNADSDSFSSDSGDMSAGEWNEPELCKKSKRRENLVDSANNGMTESFVKVDRWASILENGLLDFPGIVESVVASLGRGLHETVLSERKTSSSFEDAPTLFTSKIVHETYLQMRMRVWRILMLSRSLKGAELAVEDAVQTGIKRMKLETNSDCVNKKWSARLQYRVRGKETSCSENFETTRQTVLHVILCYLCTCVREKSNKLAIVTEGRKERLIGDAIALIDSFRTRDGFKMPRSSRALLAGCIAAALQVVMGVGEDLSLSPSKSVPDHGVLLSKLRSLKLTFQKLHCDLDGSVRLVVAGLTPILPCLATLAFEEVITDDLLMHLPGQEQDGRLYDMSEDSDSGEVTSRLEECTSDEDLQRQITLSGISDACQTVGRLARSRTALVALGELAAAHENCRGLAFYHILARSVHLRSDVDVVRGVLARVAVRSGHRTARSLFKAYSPLILAKWSESKNGIFSFPVIVLFEGTPANAFYYFLKEYIKEILPLLLLEENDAHAGIGRIAAVLGSKSDDILRENIDAIFRLYPCHFTDVVSINRKGAWIWSILRERLSDLGSISARRKFDVIAALIMSISGGRAPLGSRHREFSCEDTVTGRLGFERDTRDVQPPFYDALIVGQAIECLLSHGSDSESKRVIPNSALVGYLFHDRESVPSEFPRSCEFLRRNKEFLAVLLGRIWQSIQGPPGPTSSVMRRNAVFSLAFLWRLLGGNLLVHPMTRSMFIHVILLALQHRDVSPDALKLLGKVTKTYTGGLIADRGESGSIPRVSAYHDVISEQWRSFLSQIVPYLACIIYSARKPRATAESMLVKELLKSAVKAGAFSAVASLDPLPSLQEFAEANRYYECARAKADPHYEKPLESIRYEMERFITLDYESVFSLHPIRIRARIARLGNAIFPHVALLRKELNASASKDLALKELVSKVLYRLVSILKHCSSRLTPEFESDGLVCEEEFGVTMTLRQPGVLAEEVMVDIARIMGILGSISTISIALASCEKTFLSSFAPAKLEKDGLDDILAGACLGVSLLKSNITSGNVIVSLTSMYALVDVFAAPENRKVLSRQIPSDADYLSCFKGGSLSKRNLPANEFSRELVCPLSGVVWTEHLSGLCSAELWDPSRGTDFWMREVSVVLSTHCRSPALRSMSRACFASTDLASALIPYMMLDVIVAAESATRAALSALVSKYIINNNSCSSSLVLLILQALHLLSRERIRLIRKRGIGGVKGSPFVLDLDGLDIARAASRAGAQFAAIQQCEWYLDHTFERQETREGYVKNSSALTATWNPHLKDDVCQVMRSALQNINEPDGIHAVISGASLLETSAALAHVDSDWTLALGTNDSLKTYSGVDPRRELSIIQSLMGLGAYNVIRAYWGEVSERLVRFGWVEGASDCDIADLNEERYHAAWTMGVWDDRGTTSSHRDATVGARFAKGLSAHQATGYALRSFATGNASGALSAVREAMKVAAHSLYRGEATESAKFIYQRSGLLRILFDLELAAGVAILSKVKSAAGKDIVSGQDGIRGTEVNGLLDMMKRIGPTDDVVERDFRWLDKHWRKSDAGFLYSSEKQIDSIKLIEPLLHLRVSLGVALGLKDRVLRLTSELANVILRQGGKGVWARASRALDRGSEFRQYATSVDTAAWKIEEAKLTWMAAKDGRVKRQAFQTIKYVIANVLRARVRFCEPTDTLLTPTKSASLSDDKQSSGSERKFFPNEAQGDSSLRLSSSPRTPGGNDRARPVTSDRLRYLWESLGNRRDERTARLRAEACKLAANWALSLHTDGPMAIYQTFLTLALAAFDNVPSCEAKSSAQFTMGAFADAELNKIDTYQGTSKYEEMVRTVKANEEKVIQGAKILRERKRRSFSGALKRQGRTRSNQALEESEKFIRDLSTRLRTLEKSARHDRDKLTELTKFRDRWRLLAVEHYAAALREGYQNDIRAAFRLASIWMDANGEDPELDSHIAKDGELKIPASKLLPLSYQLSSRLSVSGKESFQIALATALRSMAIDYPHHCIWQFIALGNSTRPAPSSQRGSSLYRGDQDKADAANQILDSLGRIHNHLVADMRRLSEGYIASTQLSVNGKGQPETVRLAKSLFSLRNLSYVQVPTLPIPLHGGDPSKRDIISVSSFRDTGVHVGGINAPIKLICIGSDGRQYPQLLKGNDDLRQDAVMEQLFTIANSLLSADPGARYRSLSIRTYRVVPLTACSGILQWVSNTETLRTFLVDGFRGQRCAHIRYRPNDVTPAKIASEMEKIKKPHETAKRVRKLHEYWPRFQPVFRHFFTERYPDPLKWYSRRLAYTRSVATSSIVGYIIGLGDRHVSNILIDSCTAEVIHIDLGIAFEQGKLAPTPEKVPFRLTRDVVDGFGATGVEGVFRSCCETTLAVLRTNRDVLLTVFEVFLHDPLYRWAHPPFKVLQNQNNNDSMGTETALDDVVQNLTGVEERRDARRVLIRIGEKLDGFEGSERLSVEAHVSWLIEEAQNCDNIMCAFPGWMPWV